MEQSNPYTSIIVDEARRRRIEVEMIDPEVGDMVLTLGDRSIRTIQSLSELTSAIAYLNCDDKLRTRSVLTRADLPVPDGRLASFDQDDIYFVREHGEVVVKPVQGEGGAGVSVGVDEHRLPAALEEAAAVSPRVLIEQRCHGTDLRVLVIDGRVVAAAERRPPMVVGDGESTVARLVEDLDGRRSAATGGAVRVALDEPAEAHLRGQGFEVCDTPAEGETLQLRGTANVHVGGTIQDVTGQLGEALGVAAIDATAAVGAPIAGVDFISEDLTGATFVIIEVNEQPGLANHEPQPTAARFLDLLFPGSTRSA